MQEYHGVFSLVASPHNSKRGLKRKTRSISPFGKMKAQTRDFTESGSFPNTMAKLMITK